MHSLHSKYAFLAAVALTVSMSSAFAHLSYPAARDFGNFSLAAPHSFTISGQTTKAFGWADGTDADFGAQDDQRYFKFTLADTISITISVTALDPLQLLPAFSIFAGVGHGAADSANPDYDGAGITQQYLASLGTPARKGAFDALHTWKIGNDLGTTFADLATLTYMGNAADGTAANYGSAAGIHGDGVADGKVSSTFLLGAGTYTLAVGGANYASSDATARGFTATMSSVPEPCAALFVGAGATLLALRRRRVSSPI